MNQKTYTLNLNSRALALVALFFGLNFPQGLAHGSNTEDFVLKLHSHNDYEQSSPLLKAIKYGVHSVEADIWYDNGEPLAGFDGTYRTRAKPRFLVSHMGLNFIGSLDSLYLKPLVKLVKKGNGSVFGDGKVFYLWIEFKQGDAFLADLLHEKLMRYASIFYVGGPVQVVLTGCDAPKKKYIDTYQDLAVMRDDHSLYTTDTFSNTSPDQTTFGWGWYALSWGEFISWNGRSKITSKQRTQLKSVIAFAHAQQRKIRFYNIPNTDAAWSESLNAGADLISVDNLSKTPKNFVLKKRIR